MLSYTKSLMPNSPLGPDVVHFVIEKSWPFLPHIAKLGSRSKGRTNSNVWCYLMAYNAPWILDNSFLSACPTCCMSKIQIAACASSNVAYFDDELTRQINLSVFSAASFFGGQPWQPWQACGIRSARHWLIWSEVIFFWNWSDGSRHMSQVPPAKV